MAFSSAALEVMQCHFHHIIVIKSQRPIQVCRVGNRHSIPVWGGASVNLQMFYKMLILGCIKNT